MNIHTIGFGYRESDSTVLLIKLNNGTLSGIGGLVQDPDLLEVNSQTIEFNQQTGISTNPSSWKLFGVKMMKEHVIKFYTCSLTEEQCLTIKDNDQLSFHTVSNIKYNLKQVAPHMAYFVDVAFNKVWTK